MPKKDVHYKKNTAASEQAGIVMKTFAAGRLRSSSGETVTDPKQAKAIAMSEAEAVKERGRERRTWRGRTRMRPKKKEND